MEFLERNENDVLTKKDFVEIYTRELRGGKYWGVFYDLYSLGESLEEVHGRFEARFDFCYGSNIHVVETLSVEIPDGICLPCESHPSDHLPVGVKFCVPMVNA
eukprot:CAMPEP_0204835552 /NCGR_PEP_ID=MMETSP1346-20131115/22934_1 /ASSEMBLY_ACC=CAM_ASM_000771 /TAXON_ID=215587 /ORGANISM="Aplanochytrium stocchinoi, Strain GSBS06" /LENGTH=102 /DNA_ID=CAMNT_0051969657 /DNA_START=163 /DNA_END=471 /DNA_ORIENTATION=+